MNTTASSSTSTHLPTTGGGAGDLNTTNSSSSLSTAKGRTKTLTITQRELSECDREQIHNFGHIQGGAGNVIFFSYPKGQIIAADAKIRSVPWIRQRGSSSGSRRHRGANRGGGGGDDITDTLSTCTGSTTASSRSAMPMMTPRKRDHNEMDSNPNPTTSGENTSNNEPTENNHNNNNYKSCSDLLGSYLQFWVPYKLYLEIFDAVEGMKKVKSTRTFHFYKHKQQSFALTVSTTAWDCSVVGLEIETIDSTTTGSGGGHAGTTQSDFYSTLVSLGRIMEFLDEKIVKTACDTIFKLLGGYDRGMVYKFNDDLSGHVVHEIKKETVEKTSYLGLRFPASDIPLPARKLYVRNGLRYIYNVDEEDVPILEDTTTSSTSIGTGGGSRFGGGHDDDTNNDNNNINKGGGGDGGDGGDGGGSTIDLSHCRMRSVAKSHILYLRNMGVVSSMSIAIVVEEELWGLLSFHAYNKPYKPSLHQRIACETIKSMVSVKVEALQKKLKSVRIVELSETLMRWSPTATVATNLENLGSDILHVLDADVLVGRIQDPARDEVDTVVVGEKSLAPNDAVWSYFDNHPRRELFAINTRADLAKLNIPEDICPSCGIAYFRDDHCQIIVGRGLQSKDIRWGGNPDEPKLKIGGILHPRASFDIFMEKARKEARAWSPSDLEVISSLMDRVCKHSHNRMMSLLKSDIEDTNIKYFNAISRAQENNNFFAQMSHEIRTPFHGVMGCLNMLDESRSEMKPEEVKDLIGTALSSGNHMLHLLNDIINISKNKYLSHSITKEKHNYHVLASEATQSLKSLAVSKGIKFECQVCPQHDYIVIITDKTKVVQVVSNIINNAIKFCSQGSIDVRFQLAETRKDTIRKWSDVASSYAGSVYTMKEGEVLYSVSSVQSKVAELPELENQKWMLVSVTDSGCGMKPDELAEMLKPYTQSTGSNKAIQGTGLGLFICVSLCHQMGGFLACSSTPGEGTVFHVGFPVGTPDPLSAKCDKDSKEAHASLSLPAEIIPIYGPIVVCDDNKVNLKILQRALNSELKKRELQIQVLQANGGQACFDLYKQERPSVLFIDYHMPEVDGLQATEMIREFEAEKDLKPSYIISYTADVTERAAQLLLSCGTNEIMSKPPPKRFLADICSRFKIMK